MTDRTVIQCNYVSATGVATEGARAYLVMTNPGGGNDRIEILVRSRGGRWVRKWEDIRRLGNFRLKTLPPEHPLHGDDRIWPWPSLQVDPDEIERVLGYLKHAADQHDGRSET